jgi:hypothetical protein
MDINKEAEDYAHNHFVMQDNHYQGLKQGFITGANSKWVQDKVLQAQIDVLRFIQGNSITPYNVMIENKIKELQQQLKELEDANEI